MHEPEKKTALGQVAKSKKVAKVGKAKYCVGKSSGHIRFCSANPKAPEHSKFNINPNTLSADFELWICGNGSTYYLSPIVQIQSIYENPDAYIHRMHPKLRVVSVDTLLHEATYAAGGVRTSLGRFLRATLP
jgi:hypothetical protein